VEEKKAQSPRIESPWTWRFAALAKFAWLLPLIAAFWLTAVIALDHMEERNLADQVERDTIAGRSSLTAENVLTDAEEEVIEQAYITALEQLLTGRKDKPLRTLRAISFLYPSTDWSARAEKIISETEK
jgi:hypothetical protein